MSYPGYSNYNSYYGGSQNEPFRNGYAPARSSESNATYPDPVAYSGESRQTQYVQQEYSWPSMGQAQKSYSTPISGGQGANGSANYGENIQSQGHDYRDAPHARIGSDTRQAEIQAYKNSINQTPMQSNMQALNELAHVSGLESAGRQAGAGARNVQPPQQNRTPQNFAASQSQATKPKTNQHAAPIYGDQPHSAHFGTQNLYQTPESNKQLALQAATALEGVSKATSTQIVSPATRPAQTVPAPQQRSQSPYPSEQNATTTQQSQQSHSHYDRHSYGTNQTNLATGSSQTQSTRTQQPHNPTSNSAGERAQRHTNSVASLKTDNARQESPAHTSPTQQNSTTFINPREVFNPYHREHERARREAAAAEAAAERKTAEVARVAKQSIQPSPEVAQPGVSLTSQLSSQNVSKSNPETVSDATVMITNSQPVRWTDTESELRLMLARMRELRTKNVALFQKVWDEEKGAKTPVPAASKIQNKPPVTQGPSSVEQTAKSPEPSSKHDPDVPRGFNGYAVVLEDNPENLPDLGKFPAARRVRYSYAARMQALQTSPTAISPSGISTSPPPSVLNNSTKSSALVFNPTATLNDIPVTQPLTSNEADSSSVLPAHLRQALANTIVKFLDPKAVNGTLKITQTEMTEILSGNPSYVDLCQLLEARGFKFDRRQLAQTLLKETPALGGGKSRSQPAHSPTQNQGIQARVEASDSATLARPTPDQGPALVPISLIKPEIQSEGLSATILTMNQQNKSGASHARSRISASVPLTSTPVPGSKEEMARKRGFEDLIDLTHDDEDYIVPEKKIRLRSPSPDSITSFAQRTLPLEPIGSFVRYENASAHSMLPKPVTPLRFDAHVPHTLPEPSFSGPSKVILAKRLNKAEALRRNYYDPKTVARDFLISIGRHPTERPLNAHLAGLLGTHIELDSDLSTFHWEDIDPGGPPAPKQAWTDLPAGPPRFKSRSSLLKQGADKSKSKTRRSESALSKLDEVVDFTNGLAAKGHISASNYEDNQQVPRHLEPTRSPRNSNSQVPPHLDADPRDPEPRTKKVTLGSAKPLGSRASQLRKSQIAVEGGLLGSQPAQPKKRGRPPKTSRLTGESSLPPASPSPFKAGSEKNSVEPHQPTSSSLVPRTPTKLAASPHSSRQSESVDSATMEKRRGRPPGSKNKVPAEQRKTIAGDLQVVVPLVQAEDDIVEYPIFKCRWVKCGTELHNIPTLRKHIAKLHKPPQETVDEIGYGCYWKKCSLLRKDDDGNMEPTPIATQEAWLNHINEEHIHPLGQKHGDGPSTSHIGKQMLSFETLVSKYLYKPSLYSSDARTSSYTDPQAVASDRALYLADEQGRATTHLALSDDEPDTVVLTDIHTNDTDHNEAADAAFKAFLKNHSHHKKDLKATADEMLRAMAARKEKVGVGIDRGGCTLVNEDRRKTFLHNPGISRVVDYDY